MALENTLIQEKLVATFGEEVGGFTEPYGMLTFEADAASIKNVMQFLKEDKDLNFMFLTDLCGLHLPDNDEDCRLAVVYHLHNFVQNSRIRIKVYVSEENPVVPSVSEIFSSANWMERETFDFYGIEFEGHPNMVRILNMDEMEVFPLRKEFPLEDAGRTDKDDRFFGRTIHNQ